jgi:para-nitrobenzyl esterase
MISCSGFQSSGVGLNEEKFEVQTSSGVVSNDLGLLDLGFVSWQDIPFAQPPVGDLRWRAPRPLDSPSQIISPKDDTACVQKASVYAGAAGKGIVGSEDCLYLDITAPIDFEEKSYPVMFWIHGGGNTSGLKDYYDYSKLVSTRDVVVVRTNYRLGALGWFTHPSIQGSQEGIDKTSNFGTLDIIQSLKWVQTNISKFGGDPTNVTIFGESAGGHNVFALLSSPMADGLFHKAISQSGYTSSYSLEDAVNENGTNRLIERGSSQIIDREFGSGVDRNVLRSNLKEMDARAFIGLYYQEEGIDSIPLTTRDGIVIPEIGLLEALSRPEYAKNIPVMAGANKDEVSLWHGLHRYFIDVSYPLSKLLPPVIKLKNPDLFDHWVRTRSHAWKLRGVDTPLTALETAGYPKLYAYQFDWDHQKSSMFADIPSIIGAAHGTDISFVTGDYKFGPISSYVYPEGPNRNEMEKTIMDAWTGFSRSGTPDTDMSIHWQPFEGTAPAFLHLDKDDLLRVGFEEYSMESLLDSVAESGVSNLLQKCMIVWESSINIGDPLVDLVDTWQGGQCNKYDVLQEQKDIQYRLISEFGSVTID